MTASTPKRKIGEVARELGICERRIREYERAGLVRPEREPKTGDRLFDQRDVRQIELLRALMHVHGFTIKAIRVLLAYAPCWELTGCGLQSVCPVPRNPDRPCYEQRAAGAQMPCQTECARCPIHGAKDGRRAAIVLRPAIGAGDDRTA